MAGSGARQNRRERRKSIGNNAERYENQEKPPAAPKTPQVIHLRPRSEGQRHLQQSLLESRLVIACGPAGTGKTAFCVGRAVDLFIEGQVEKLIFARPAVEAGEKIGFLPGGAREKLDPYLRPLFDELATKIGGAAGRAPFWVEKWIKSGALEIVPLGMMRGRTFKNAAIVLDEMQNATYSQWKMAITRIGYGSHMFVTGDPEQSDVGEGSGMRSIISRFEGDGRYPVAHLRIGDVQRDEIVSNVLSFL